MIIRVVGHHRFQLEAIQNLPVTGGTDEALGVGRHEVDGFRRHKVSSHDQITFIFTVWIIGHKNHFTGFDVGNGLFDGPKLIFFSISFISLEESIFKKGCLCKAPI